METYKITSGSEQKTIEIAKKIASVFQKGDIILLDGTLGTGKTHFVKGIAEHFNYNENVTSPTFNIANFYETKNITLLHIDLYRIETIEEFNDLGIYEYFSDSIVFIEWGKKFSDYFDDFLSVNLEYIENEKNKRILSFSSIKKTYKSKIDIIKKTLLN